MADFSDAEKQNLKIKFRESFRPFAPIIKEDKVSAWFDCKISSPYMLIVSNLKEDRILKKFSNKQIHKGFDKKNQVNSVVPSVIHVDLTARLQTVNKGSNKSIYEILDYFEKITNCPMLINTSFIKECFSRAFSQ